MMRANLRGGKLVPPRSYEHAERRLKQLKHELEGIDRRRGPARSPSVTELALRDEFDQLTLWMENWRTK